MDGPTDIDALADALREDGVVVDRVMGSGEADAAHDRIAALVRETPFPVYVALVDAPEGLPADAVGSVDALAGLLNRRLGDGLYVLDTTEGIQRVYSYGLDADPVRLSIGAGRNTDLLDETMQEVGGYRIQTEDYIYPPAFAKAEMQAVAAGDLVDLARGPDDGEYPATVTAAEAEEVARRALEVEAVASWRPGASRFVEVRSASHGLSAIVGGLSALVIALLLGQTLRGWPRTGRASGAKGKGADRAAAPPAAVPLPVLEDERRRATRLADALARAIERTDWERVRDRDLADRALTARDAVEPLLQSADVADVIGARVLAQVGMHDLGRGRRGEGPRLVPCFFDPRHREATTFAAWRLGDGEVDVPCCAGCGLAMAHDGHPPYLSLPSRRGAQPYWERDDVWSRTGFGSISDDLARDVLADRAGER